MTLTPHEIGLIRLVERAMTNAEIAEALKITPQVVRNSFYKIYNKTGASDRVELAVWASKGKFYKVNQARR